MTLRCSAVRTLKVRHAALVSMTSKPMPWRMMSVATAPGGKICVVPVPNTMTSGAALMAAEKSVMLKSMMSAGDQFSIIMSIDTMT